MGRGASNSGDLPVDIYADCVDSPTMNGLLAESTAAVLICLDETGGARLTEIATATGKSLSTLQRVVHGLLRAGVLQRETPRGRLLFATDAPRQALRDVAEWRLGPVRTQDLGAASRYLKVGGRSLPASIKRPEICRALPVALGRIVTSFQPSRVVLFGSQARGDANSQSDVDLLVVFANVDAGDRRERQVAIRHALEDMPFAKDVLVASDERYQQPLPGTAVKSAVAEGITLYER